MDINQAELGRKLASDDGGTQMRCLDDVAAFVKAGGVLSEPMKNALMACLTSSEHRYFVAERLAAMAGQLVGELRHLLASDVLPDVKFSASLLLLCANVRDGVPMLLDAVRFRSESRYLIAARLLAEAGDKSVIPSIMGSIRDLAADGKKLQHKDSDAIAALIDCLQYLGVSLPPKLFEKLSAEDAPWQIRAALGFAIDREKIFGPRNS